MKVQHVPIEWVPQTWPLVEPYLVEALKHAQGDYTLEHMQVYLTTGQKLLLVATEDSVVHGAAVIEMFNRPTKRVAYVSAIGGRLISSRDTFQQLKELVASFGATAIEGAARESVARLWRRYGFEEKYRIVGAKL